MLYLDIHPKSFIVGILIGATLTMGVVATHKIYHRNPNATYATFYIIEKKGIRPASTILNYPLTKVSQLEAAEMAILKKYDNKNILDIMLFGSPVILEDDRIHK